jgi:hypothetical protein
MRRHPEQDIQKALADHPRLRAGTYWFHSANGGPGTAIEGAILKACAVPAGAPDGVDAALAQLETWGLLQEWPQ